jgi:hypothetical protein
MAEKGLGRWLAANRRTVTKGKQSGTMGSIKDLMGLTISKIEGAIKGSTEIEFEIADGRRFRMEHSQQCCESVRVEDVCGDINDLIGFPVVRAEQPSSADEPKSPGESVHSWTWTFYILGTSRGTVTFRWLGKSNGCYSERVNAEWVST